MNFLTTLWARALVVCLAVGLLGMLYFAWAEKQQKIGHEAAWVEFEAALAKQKTQAQALLKTETDKVTAAQKALNDFKNTQEIKDVQNAKVVSDLTTKLRDLGRLRDPGKTTRCGPGSGPSEGGSPTSPSSGPNDTAEAGGLLSAELTEFLLTQAIAADQINSAYISCRDDSLNLRSIIR